MSLERAHFFGFLTENVLELLGNMYVVVYVQGTFFSSESNLKTTVVCKGKKLQEKSKPCVDI